MIMKLLNHSIKTRVLWLLASCAALLLSTPMPGLHAQKSRDETQNSTTWIQQDNNQKRSLEIRGKAEFTDDYTDIKSVSEGGFNCGIWLSESNHLGEGGYMLLGAAFFAFMGWVLYRLAVKK